MSTLDELTLVLERSKALGFLGPGDVDSHIRHARIFDGLLEDAERVLDLGSGGGLPGLVIAIDRPDVRLTLLDSNERRIAFLRGAIRDLSLDGRVDAVLGRAEELARTESLREQFDVLVARSFGRPAVTAECGAAFVRQGGRLLVSEPLDAEDRWPADGLAALGLVPGPLVRSAEAGVRVLERCAGEIDAVPRRVGVPGRRPLF